MRYLQKVHLFMQSKDAVLLHKNSMLNFCADGSEIDSYSSKIFMFAIVNIVFRLIITKILPLLPVLLHRPYYALLNCEYCLCKFLEYSLIYFSTLIIFVSSLINSVSYTMCVYVCQYLYQIYVKISSFYWIIAIKPKSKKFHVTVIDFLLFYLFILLHVVKIIASSKVKIFSRIYNLQCHKSVLEN